MAKILVATDKPFAAIAVKGIREVVEGAGDELILLEKYGEKAKLLDAVKDVDAIIIRSDIIDAEVLDAAKQLKIVVRAGAGYDNVDLAAATAHNVCVMNTPGQNSNAVAFGNRIERKETGYPRIWQRWPQCGSYRKRFWNGNLCIRCFLPSFGN